MGDLADRLSVRLTDAYRELELMRRDGLVDEVQLDSDVYALTELGRKALDVLDDVRAGPPGWRQTELW
jgi:DNA-binding PadR family transcriptional regulator